MSGLEFTAEELEEIFGGQAEDKSSTSTNEGEKEKETPPQEESSKEDAEAKRKEETRAFSKRLNEEREKIAKTMGFESYEQMMKSNEDKLIADKGFNPEEVAPLVNELVEKRLQNDPRLKELEGYRKQQAKEFGERELAEISKLTGGEISRLEQLPRDTIEEWKRTGSLKKAFLTTHGEEYITKARATSSKGTTSHLHSPAGTPPVADDSRPLTSEEKAVWRQFFPGISEEELNKKTTKIRSK